jgi:hypothetical protein
LTAVYLRSADRLFLSVDLARGHDGAGNVETNIRRGLTIHFDQAHNHFIRELGFLQRQHAHAIVVNAQEGKALS